MEGRNQINFVEKESTATLISFNFPKSIRKDVLVYNSELLITRSFTGTIVYLFWIHINLLHAAT